MRPFLILIRNHVFGLRTAMGELREQPKLKVAFVGGFSLCWLLGLSWIFYEGFAFLNQRGGVAFGLVPDLFTLFFLGLGLMLMLSGAVTGYANLFQTPEVKRLLTWPVPTRDLFYYALVKSTLMSSWAFFFIIVPMISSYGIQDGWGPGLLLWSAVYSVPYVMLFSGLGVFLMLLIVRWFPRGRTLGLIGALLLVTLITWAMNYVKEVRSSQSQDMLVLINFIPGLRLASQPVLPNSWMANGILAFTKDEMGTGILYFLLLCSSVGVLFLFLAKLGEWVYPSALQRQITGSTQLNARASSASRFLQYAFPGRASVRAFGIKDALIFLRDPTQWTQFLIFFGLLGLYFINLGSLGYNDLGYVWSNLIAFLNMFSLSAVMSSLSARFVFPQMSMETRALWMVGLAPHSMSRLMIIKFGLATLSLSIVGMTLSRLSTFMLGVSGHTALIGSVLMPSMAIALSGMSIGLGAIFMEVRPKTPAQILSGYGGTLNLILSLVTVILLVMIPGMVSHFMLENRFSPGMKEWIFPMTLLYIVVLSLFAAGLPLWLGHRSLQSRDY